MATIGIGEGHPLASNATADGRARNRRIELTVSPLLK
jgi:outer membrane protein OmpA-like peptidoglycan-associated protein